MVPQHIPGQHMELHYGRNLWRYPNLIIRNIISNLCNESHWQRRLIKHKLVNKGTADPVRHSTTWGVPVLWNLLEFYSPCHTGPYTTEIWSECNATDNSTGHEIATVCIKILSLCVHGGFEEVRGNSGHSERPKTCSGNVLVPSRRAKNSNVTFRNCLELHKLRATRDECAWIFTLCSKTCAEKNSWSM